MNQLSPAISWRQKQSMQRVKNGQPGYRKEVSMRSEDFFNAKGVIYMNYVPKGKPVNAEYVEKALARFLVVFRQ
jgi:hypothetical protein